jgi:hypothetical protein
MTQPASNTELVQVHLENDGKQVSHWKNRAREINDNIPESLSGGLDNFLEDEVISEEEATRTQLAHEIREYMEEYAKKYKHRAQKDMSSSDPIPGLFSTAIEQFLGRVDWKKVSSRFIPEELSETL